MLSLTPLYFEKEEWQFEQGGNGFSLSTLRQLSICVPLVSLTEGALSCPQSIHHCNTLADLMSASLTETGRHDDGGRR